MSVVAPLSRRAVEATIAGLTLTACLTGDPNPLGPDASASGGQSPPPTAQPGAACSQRVGAAVTLTFKNNLADRSVALFWVDFQCNEIRYRDIAPGASYQQPTYVGHPWRMRDAQTNALYKEFTAATPTPVTVTIP